MRGLGTAIFAALLLLLLPLRAHAQDGVSLSGHVVEETGAGVPQLTVTLAPRDAAGARADIITATDTTGAFRFTDVPPGHYALEVTGAGTPIYQEDLQLTHNARREITVRRSQ